MVIYLNLFKDDLFKYSYISWSSFYIHQLWDLKRNNFPSNIRDSRDSKMPWCDLVIHFCRWCEDVMLSIRVIWSSERSNKNSLKIGGRFQLMWFTHRIHQLLWRNTHRYSYNCEKILVCTIQKSIFQQNLLDWKILGNNQQFIVTWSCLNRHMVKPSFGLNVQELLFLMKPTVMWMLIIHFTM